jgi:hypothetical protein
MWAVGVRVVRCRCFLEIQSSSVHFHSQHSLAKANQGHTQIAGMSSIWVCQTERLAQSISCSTLAPCFRFEYTRYCSHKV